MPETHNEEDSDEAEYLTSEEEVEEDDVDSRKETKDPENEQTPAEFSNTEIPARIRERQKMFAPWMRQSVHTNRETNEFNTDGVIETVVQSN